MKHNILTHSITALLVALPIAHADDQKAEEKKDAPNSETKHSSSSVINTADGTATVTIDINGKKETRTFKLIDGNTTLPRNAAGNGVRDFSLMKSNVRTNAKTERGTWLGIGMDPVQEVVRAQLPLAPEEGVVVSHVMVDSPAQKAGLSENDILVRFDEQIIVEPAQMRKLIAMKKPGDTVKLAYIRKGERKETTVTLIEHEFEASRPDASMPWLQPFQRWQGLDNAARSMEDLLRQLRKKHPGIVAEKWSWPSGPAGTNPWDQDRIKRMVDQVRKDLENSTLPKEEQDRICKNVEETMEHTRKSLEDLMTAIKRSRKDDGENKSDERPKPAEKKPGESL